MVFLAAPVIALPGALQHRLELLVVDEVKLHVPLQRGVSHERLYVSGGLVVVGGRLLQVGVPEEVAVVLAQAEPPEAVVAVDERVEAPAGGAEAVERGERQAREDHVQHLERQVEQQRRRRPRRHDSGEHAG